MISFDLMFTLQYEFNMRRMKLSKIELESVRDISDVKIEKDLLRARNENYEAENDLMNHFFK